jgi:hypothetical protein
MGVRQLQLWKDMEGSIFCLHLSGATLIQESNPRLVEYEMSPSHYILILFYHCLPIRKFGNHQWVEFYWTFLILNNKNAYISQFHLRAHNTINIPSTLPGSGRHTGCMLFENATGWSRCRRAMSLVSKNGWKCEWNSTACTPRVTWSVSLGDVKSWSPSCRTRSSMGVSRLHPGGKHLIAVL